MDPLVITAGWKMILLNGGLTREIPMDFHKFPHEMMEVAMTNRYAGANYEHRLFIDQLLPINS